MQKLLKNRIFFFFQAILLLSELCQGCAVIVAIIAGGKAGGDTGLIVGVIILIAVLVIVIIVVVIAIATAIYNSRRCNRGMYMCKLGMHLICGSCNDVCI